MCQSKAAIEEEKLKPDHRKKVTATAKFKLQTPRRSRGSSKATEKKQPKDLDGYMKWKDKQIELLKEDGRDFAGITDLNKWIGWQIRKCEQLAAHEAYEQNVNTTVNTSRRRQLLFDTGSMVHACRKEFARHGQHHRF